MSIELSMAEMRYQAASEAGQLSGVAGMTDVVDASVVAAARETRANVLTSDPNDLLRLNHRLDIVVIERFTLER